jgi:hypothetical protein
MTFDKEGLASLVERVREATGPDRDIDQAIREAIDGKMMERQLLWRETFPYSASIDASLALVGRCGFPLGQGKWNYTMAAAYGSFSIIPNDPNSTGIHDKRCGHAHGAPTIPLAILIALLSAIEASNAQ